MLYHLLPNPQTKESAQFERLPNREGNATGVRVRRSSAQEKGKMDSISPPYMGPKNVGNTQQPQTLHFLHCKATLRLLTTVCSQATWPGSGVRLCCQLGRGRHSKLSWQYSGPVWEVPAGANPRSCFLLAGDRSHTTVATAVAMEDGGPTHSNFSSAALRHLLACATS